MSANDVRCRHGHYLQLCAACANGYPDAGYPINAAQPWGTFSTDARRFTEEEIALARRNIMADSKTNRLRNALLAIRETIDEALREDTP